LIESVIELRHEPHARDGVEVCIDRGRVQFDDERMAGRRQLDPFQVHGVDLDGDVDVDGRHDLRSVFEVDLVSVVAGWVVAGGDHHPGDGPQVRDGPREHRRGARPGHEHRLHPEAGRHRGHVAGEGIALVTGVVADDDAPLGRPRLVREQIPHQARRGPPHRHAVHAHRPGAELAPEPRGAELETAGEALGQRRGIARLRSCHER
jgi:hypothetical protein